MQNDAPPSAAPAATAPENFIYDIVEADGRTGKHGGRVRTRFPPEPNGYLHIGHAKSICLNFGIAGRFAGLCNLRFDDTNPTKEEIEYVESIQRDVRWLGFDWDDRLFFASDYFERIYGYTEELIRTGKAYVCSLSPQDMKEYRGNYYVKGRESPYRDRTPEESLDLLRRMRAGEFPDGAHTVRAKIDMSSQNMNLRDPPLYRIRHATHHRTGDAWCIYPTYDYAHPLSDAIEGITHSICTLEFENHRPLYDWCLNAVADPSWPARPQQIEFARLNLSYTVLSKRKLLELVRDEHVSGWDDPRMPTLSGMRRRGYSPAAIRAFCDRIGVARADSIVDVGLLEHAVREDLNATAPRVMAVLNPLRVVIENFPEGHVEEIDAPYFPDEPARGTRKVLLTREIFVEQEDFREVAPKKWFRLSPGREVRLRYGCLITCREAIKNEAGEVIELRCTWDPASRGGNAPDGRRVNGTLHWVSAAHAVPAEVRLYDRLFIAADPLEETTSADWLTALSGDSVKIIPGCLAEPSLVQTPSVYPPQVGMRYQFERLGYFCVDVDSKEGRLVFNRTVSLKDSWAKTEAKTEAKPADAKTPRGDDKQAAAGAAPAHAKAAD